MPDWTISRIDPVVSELAVVDGKRAEVACQHTHFVIEEAVIIQDEIAGLHLDAGAVAIGDQSSREGKIIDCDVTIGDEDGFAVRNQAGRYEVDLSADTLQSDIFTDRGPIVGI